MFHTTRLENSDGGFCLSLQQSFAKNAGLYGERVGALHVVSPGAETADRVRSQLSVLQRSEISNPPSHGARLVSWSTILAMRCLDETLSRSH